MIKVVEVVVKDRFVTVVRPVNVVDPKGTVVVLVTVVLLKITEVLLDTCGMYEIVVEYTTL